MVRQWDSLSLPKESYSGEQNEPGEFCHLLTFHSMLTTREQIVQIASGIAYLHTFEPVIIHGDLKGVRHSMRALLVFCIN